MEAVATARVPGCATIEYPEDRLMRGLSELKARSEKLKREACLGDLLCVLMCNDQYRDEFRRVLGKSDALQLQEWEHMFGWHNTPQSRFIDFGDVVSFINSAFSLVTVRYPNNAPYVRLAIQLTGVISRLRYERPCPALDVDFMTKDLFSQMLKIYGEEPTSQFVFAVCMRELGYE